jgi:hypothetical protein
MSSIRKVNHMLSDLTVCTCSYNTPLITMTMIRSWFKRHPWSTPFVIIENSTNEDTADLLKGQGIPFTRNPGGPHSTTVDLALDQVKTRYALLVDTDVVFLRDHSSILQDMINNGAALTGEVCGSRGMLGLYKRVHPWHCFIDMDKIRSKGIHFHCPNRSLRKVNDLIYDVGASMYEDVINAGFTVYDWKGDRDYYYHYEGMSWRSAGYNSKVGVPVGQSIINNNCHADEGLYKWGLEVAKEYFDDRDEPAKYAEVPLHVQK